MEKRYLLFRSIILNKEAHYSVYLPPDYETSERSYPVMYLLHGFSNDNTTWVQYGEINRLADKAIADGTIPPMIIVMPDAGTSWYINSFDGKENHEDLFENYFGTVMGHHLKANQRLNDTWYKNSILKIVSEKSADELKKVRYWIDCGDDDFFSKANCLLHIALLDKHVPHEFRMRDGNHNWTYWRTGIIDALQFIGQSFRQ